MQIALTANRESYQLNTRVNLISIQLLQVERVLVVQYDNFSLRFDHLKNPFIFSEKIKGHDRAGVSNVLREFNFDNKVVEWAQRTSLIEIALFKALFLVYQWVEIAFTDAYAVSLSSKIYDEFIIDYNNNVGPQKDIYFIKYEHITTTNLPLLTRLVELNLLVHAVFSGGGLGNNETYFTPIFTPGVSRKYFESPADTSGNKTFGLWKTILDDRDKRINNWFTNRF